MTHYIDISVPAFNVLKYIFIALLLTPLTEFLARSSIRVLAKTILLRHGSVTISDSRAGFWGLHSHYLGHGWIGKLLILVTAAWLIASEMLFEFSFTSGPKTKSDVNEVWTTTPAPSWDAVVQTVFEKKNGDLEYYGTTHDVDYDLIYDGISTCQTAVFEDKVEQEANLLVIKQTEKWVRSYRSHDKLSTFCGENGTATLTATVVMRDIPTPGTGIVGLFPDGENSAALGKHIVQRLLRFSAERKLLWVFDILESPWKMYVSKDRMACVEQFDTFTFCVMQDSESSNLNMYSIFRNDFDPKGIADVTKKVGVFVPRETQRDSLLTLAESIAVVMSIGSFRPSISSTSGFTLSARQFREIMEVFLSLDTNGGITRHTSTTRATVRSETSDVIFVNSNAFIATALWGSLLLLFSTVVVVCNIVGNCYRAKNYTHPGLALGRPALHEIAVALNARFFVDKVKHDEEISKVIPRKRDRPNTVEFRLVNEKEYCQRITVLEEEEGLPRNYALRLTGIGSKPDNSRRRKRMLEQTSDGAP